MTQTPNLTGDILIVDDERSMREFLAIYLRRAGHRVEAVPGSEEAQTALRAKEYDVVITDLRMTADVSGLQVLAAAKSLRPDTQVIVVTAFATAETAIAAMKAGAYDYLTKPFKVEEVGLVVERRSNAGCCIARTWYCAMRSRAATSWRASSANRHPCSACSI
ncbi:MAG: response regulator [Deltaproteobacteria bacterium]|nr:response regulator [Deltaproteobacteria bacterium]